jgi:hypothetical protein
MPDKEDTVDNKNGNAGFAPYFDHAPTDSFSLKVGGTVYEVTTHFASEGRQSVLEQFMGLLDAGAPPQI